MGTGQKNRPVIGYTTRDFTLDPLHLAIAFSIWLAGGRPLRLKPSAPQYHRQIDGLIIGGGTDLYPALFSIDPKPDYEYDRVRDRMEIRWLGRAEEEGLAVLGICRGAQLMNVRRGGTLHIDIGKIFENAKYPAHVLANIFYRKMIYIEPDTQLARLVQAEKIKVNSMHKQSIDHVGRGLVVSAKEDNGIVQGVEDPSRDFFLGVQFHPETLIYRKPFRALFKALVTAARAV